MGGRGFGHYGTVVDYYHKSRGKIGQDISWKKDRRDRKGIENSVQLIVEGEGGHETGGVFQFHWCNLNW